MMLHSSVRPMILSRTPRVINIHYTQHRVELNMLFELKNWLHFDKKV